jgi:hypothetical protein
MNNQVKPLGVQVNKEQATLLLKGLNMLPESDKRVVIYDSLKRDLETVVVIWDRLIKTQTTVQEERRKLKEERRKAGK